MTDRPRPLRAAATAQSTAPTIAGGSATALLLAAIAAHGQADLVALVLAAAIVVINLVTPILAARRTAAAGERDVTPVGAPQDDDGTPLVRWDGPLFVEVLTKMLDQLLAVRTGQPEEPAAEPSVAETAAMPVVGPLPRRDPASAVLPPPSYRDTSGRHAFRDRP